MRVKRSKLGHLRMFSGSNSFRLDTSRSATWHSRRCQILGGEIPTSRLASRSARGPGGFMVALREAYEDGQPRVAFTGEHPFTANDKRHRVPASTPPRLLDWGVKCPSLEANGWVAGHCPISQVVRPKPCRQSLHQSTGTQTKIGSYKSRLISGGFITIHRSTSQWHSRRSPTAKVRRS
jgi:hypothetical protein